MRKKIFYGSPNKVMDFIWSNKITATIYSISNTIFMLEKKIKSGNFPKTVRIDYYVNLSDEQIKKICILLNNLVIDVLYENIKFILVKNILKGEGEPKKFKKCETICLFSGGIDSTLGILESKKYYGEVIGLYIAHQDLGKITNKVNKIIDNFLNKKGIEFIKFIAPAMGRDYAQIRGFLYIMYSTILAYFTFAKRIIVSECGITMYQPKFAPMDSITYTTHPLVLKSCRLIAKIFLNREIEIITPFEDFTKTEMMKLIMDDKILSQTHSCITGRWDKNCGVCYACIVRMIGSINLGLSLDYFKSNVFEQKDNEILNAMLNFCINFELDRKELDYWSLQTIEKYNKENLFKRFCREVMLCLQKLEERNELDITSEFILGIYIKEKGLDLIFREKELKDFNRSPDFNKKVL